jgi:hypothetical protein
MDVDAAHAAADGPGQEHHYSRSHWLRYRQTHGTRRPRHGPVKQTTADGSGKATVYESPGGSLEEAPTVTAD